MPGENHGRVDLLVCATVEQFVKQRVEPGLNGFPLWACGVGDFVGDTVKAAGITNKPVNVPGVLIDWVIKGLK